MSVHHIVSRFSLRENEMQHFSKHDVKWLKGRLLVQLFSDLVGAGSGSAAVASPVRVEKFPRFAQ